jgi:hypothetical protein
MQANYLAFKDAFPHKVPAEARYVGNYLQLQYLGLKYFDTSGGNGARISKIDTKKRK